MSYTVAKLGEKEMDRVRVIAAHIKAARATDPTIIDVVRESIAWFERELREGRITQRDLHGMGLAQTSR